MMKMQLAMKATNSKQDVLVSNGTQTKKRKSSRELVD